MSWLCRRLRVPPRLSALSEPKDYSRESYLRPRGSPGKPQPILSPAVRLQRRASCSEASGGEVICPETLQDVRLCRSTFAESDKGRKQTEPSLVTKTRPPIRRLSHCTASPVQVYSAMPEALFFFFFFIPEICGLGNLFFIFN